MTTYEKYLKLDEKSVHMSQADLVISRVEDLMADFEIAKDEIQDKGTQKLMDGKFQWLDKSFGTFKKELMQYAKLADKKV